MILCIICLYWSPCRELGAGVVNYLYDLLGQEQREAIQFEVKMEDIKQKIVGLLRDKLPASLLPNVDEIEELITQGKYRAAYLKMHEIRKDALWSPTSEYLHLMEKFWWEYAN